MNQLEVGRKMQQFKGQYGYGYKKTGWVCLQNIFDYSPFGAPLDGRTIQSDFYRRGFNGMEKDDELKGLGNSYDFGARMYDPRVSRFLSRDNFAGKFSFQSPYVFANNTPIMGKDINGDSVYIVIYAKGSTWHNGDDDRMFKAAAKTRKNEIESSKSFNKKTDKVVLLSVESISDVKYRVEWSVEKYSGKYGKTAEVSILSHSGLNGPIGSKQTKQFALEEYQMTLEGWGNINYNWGDNANMMVLGCNSGNSEKSGSKLNFALNLSGMENYKNVTIWGQKKSSFPSLYTDERESTENMDSGKFSDGKKVYMIGSEGGIDDVFFNDAYKMTRAKNGRLKTPAYQPGTKEP